MTRRAVISQADLVRAFTDAEATIRNFQIVPTVKESLTTDAAIEAAKGE